MTPRREIWALFAALLLIAATGFAQSQPPVPPSEAPDPRVVNPDEPLPPINVTTPNDTTADPNSTAEPNDTTTPSETPATSGVNSQPPLPAGRGFSSAYEPAEADPAQAIPDTNTLAGIAPIGLGSMGLQRNLFDPAAVFSMLGDTQGVQANGQPGFVPSQLAGANILYSHLWGRNQFEANYYGGATIYDHGSEPDSTFQSALLQQELYAGRWTFHLLDSFLYSPQAYFGGNGMGGPGLINEFSGGFGSSLLTLGEFFAPSETIETGYARRYRNSALGEAQYAFSRRSAFTISGSYGMLNFIDPGYISSRQANVQAGYDYQLSPKNSVAVLGNYGIVNYLGNSSSTTDEFAALAFGRKITGRLAFEVAAGPEEIHPGKFRIVGPLNGNYRLWMATVRGALTYQRGRTSYSASFVRGLQNGAGVFFGSRSDTMVLSGTHQFTHVWSMSLDAGYSFNAAIIPVGIESTNFNHWYIGVSTGRQLNSHARIDFSYGLQKQDMPKFCPVLNCGFVGYDNTFSITANWHLHPVLQ